ncbi:MAG: hypothetical protein CL694_10215 [Chloroflexi bacterium]|nr:hypothetical protein [Chloroflexota bacterium]
MDGTLSDLKVVEYSTGVSGAMCAKALADFGADIIKVEPSEGDASRQIGPFPDEAANPEASGQFIYLNANKKGVTLDLRSPEARQQMGRLLANADIFVTDLSPTAADAFGLSYRALGEAHHRLICTYVTPFGNTGPYKDYQGTDLIVWHMGGMGWETPALAVTDPESEPPLRGRGTQAEQLAGWVAATAAIVAIYHRETYGVGQEVDVSAMEAVANHIRGNFATYSYDISQLPETREQAMFRWVWPCKDGYVSAAFTFDHWWQKLKELMGAPAWADREEFTNLPGRRDHMVEIEERVIEWLSGKTRFELYKDLQTAGVPCFPVLNMAEILDSPHYKSREFFVEQNHPVAGAVKQPGPPFRMSRSPWQIRRPAPALGQHNDEILGGDGPTARRDDAPLQGRAAEARPANKPLQGIRIIDFGWILSVPHCGAWLGTLGAEVIRVESNTRLELGRMPRIGAPADGIPGMNRSALWNGLNYSKLGVTLNIRDPDAKELVKELVAVSDVVMENFATGVLERLGLGYQELRKVKPDLVMLSGSTMGVTGPEREATGFGPNVASYAGQPFLTGYEGGAPQNQGGNWPDYLVGTMMAFGILSALLQRAKTGEGQYIEAAMSEVISSLLPEAFLEYTMNGTLVERIGNHDPNMAPHNVYRSLGEDAWLAIAVRNDDEWRAMCHVLGQPELALEPRFLTLAARKSNESALDEIVQAWTRTLDPTAAMELLQGAGVPAGPVMDVIALMGDPQIASRGFAVEMVHPEVGERTVAGIPARFGAIREPAYFHAPQLGQHNDFVFGNVLGHPPEQVGILKASKAIY